MNLLFQTSLLFTPLYSRPPINASAAQLFIRLKASGSAAGRRVGFTQYAEI